MTDETKEKVSEEKQETGLPQPEFSETPVSPTSALTPEQISAFSKALVPVIEESVERKLQSMKDKRFSTLEKGEGVMKEALAILKNQGVAIPKDLEQELNLRDYVDQKIAQAVATGQDKSMSTQVADSKGAFNVVEELKKIGLDTNDADVVNLVSGKYRNPDHFRAEAMSLALRKAKSPTPTDSTTQPISGGGGQSKLSEEKREELSGQLIDLLREPTANAAKIAAIQAQLKG